MASVHLPRKLRGGVLTALRIAALLACVVTVTFLIFSVLPSDPARIALGINASEGALQQFRTEMGYDRPIPARLIGYFGDLLQLDFGRSLATRLPVGPDLVEAVGHTARYVGLGLLAACSFSLAGLFLIQKLPRLKAPSVVFARGVMGLPGIVVALLVVLLLLATDALSFLGSVGRENVVAGAIAIALQPAAGLYEILVSESARADRRAYVLAARSVGFPERIVFRRYVLRSALLPWFAHLSNVAAGMVAGSIVIEAVFSLPGLGRLVLQSVLRNDYPMMQAIVVVSTISFLSVTWMVNWTLARMYPHGV